MVSEAMLALRAPRRRSGGPCLRAEDRSRARRVREQAAAAQRLVSGGGSIPVWRIIHGARNRVPPCRAKADPHGRENALRGLRRIVRRAIVNREPARLFPGRSPTPVPPLSRTREVPDAQIFIDRIARPVRLERHRVLPRSRNAACRREERGDPVPRPERRASGALGRPLGRSDESWPAPVSACWPTAFR